MVPFLRASLGMGVPASRARSCKMCLPESELPKYRDSEHQSGMSRSTRMSKLLPCAFLMATGIAEPAEDGKDASGATRGNDD